MALIDLVQEKIIKTPLTATDKPGILRELVQILTDAGEIDDFDAVLTAIQEREDPPQYGPWKTALPYRTVRPPRCPA